MTNPDPTDPVSQAALVAALKHRVRNTLATTRMIAQRSAELSDNLEDYAAHLDGRLAALARVQAIILSDPRAGVDLGRLVTDELTAVLAYQEGRALVEGPEVTLHLRAAEPIALALHELATNAIKYGALSLPSGRISVAWRIEDGKPAPHLVFDWVEHGMRLHGLARHHRGFGMLVLEEMLAHTLQAQGSLAFEPEGAHYCLLLPLTERALHEG
ncbi:HWE histidine kinase domain-containing protein [Methylobacterium sp. M6A4_1b]